MPLDYGFYNALNASPDYNARRRDKAMELQITQANDAHQRGLLEQRAQAQNAINSYYREVDQATNQLLPQDMKRVSSAANALKQPIIDAIKKYGNDTDMFRLMGGESMLQDWQSQVQQLPEYRQGLTNLSNYSSALKDLHDGKQALRWVNYRLNDGTTKQGTFAQNLSDFNAGNTDEISYGGSFDLPKFNPLEYSKIKRDGSQVGMGEHVSNLIQAGELNPEDAPQYLQEFGKMFEDPTDPNKTVYRWGEQDPLDAALKQARISKLTGGTGSGNELTNFFLPRDFGGANGMFKPDYADQVNWNGQPKTVEFYNYPQEWVNEMANAVGIGHTKVKGANVYGHSGMPATFKTDDGQDVNVDKYSIVPNSVNGVYVIRDPNDPTKTIQALKMTINVPAEEAQNIKGSNGQALMGTMFPHSSAIPGAETNAQWTFWNNLVHPLGGGGQGFNIEVYKPLSTNDLAKTYYQNKTNPNTKGFDQQMINDITGQYLDDYLTQDQQDQPDQPAQ